MAEERLQRRLAAILSADVVGYSRLMCMDEAGTLSRLNALRRQLIDPTIAAHSGRVVKLMGDGALVEFASAVDAVNCAIEIQSQLRAHDAGGSDPILFRIGINVGDIIIEGEDIYGDGVNIAARLEGLAEPGGIYVSRAVHEHVAGKVAAAFSELGLRRLKNIATPVHVFRVAGHGERLEESVPPIISDRPSIAVLPFNSLSENRNMELLADGLVEDVIALLARVPGFFVIARSSSFAYRNRTQDVRHVGRELGVRMSSKAASVPSTNVPEFQHGSSRPRAENKSGRNALTWN
jgi:adenylate cyclase